MAVDAGASASSGEADGALDVMARVVRVGSLVGRPPVTCLPSTPIVDAAGLMARERISSVMIPHAGGIGILTDRDLRTRVVAEHRDPGLPISTVMTERATTISGSAMVGEVILAMLEGGFHHLPVTADGGQVIGVVTDTDVIGLGRDSPFLLKRAIERAEDAERASEVARSLPRVVRSMVEAGIDPVDVGYAVALMTDSLTVRFIDLAMEKLGAAPTPWSWLALGSEARREQGLHSDQDHAIAYEPGPADDVDPYYADLAESVTADLEAAGIPRCRGGVMATEQALRRPLGHWVQAFRSWTTDVGVTGSTQASIVFDLRRIAGPLAAEEPLDGILLEARRHPGFAAHLAHRALDLRPPLGLFDRLVTARGGPHAGTIDVKHRGLLILTGFARAGALAHGITEKSTVGRLRSLAGIGEFDEETLGGIEEAFRFLWGVRLRHQVHRAAQGAEPDDHVDPRNLGPVTRPALREAFRVTERAQRLLALDLALRIR